MKDSELRATVLRHLQELEKSTHNLGSALDIISDELKSLSRVQAKLLKLVQAPGGDEPLIENFDAEPLISTEPPAIEAASANPRDSGPELAPFEQELVRCYNEEPDKWRRRFSPIGFGAENVNEIWEKGGEPKFAKKEGGIYNLVVDGGVCYVVPEPGLPLNEGYVKSEGLSYLFDVAGYALDKQPPVALIRPATVEESFGRWTISQKGKIQGRR